MSVAGAHEDRAVASASRRRSVLDLARVRARYSVRAVLSRHPSLYLPMVRRKYRGQIVEAGTEVVIEAFPRSGNTFAVVAFQLAQARPVQIAHHLHAAAQVTQGVRLRKPTLVLIRDPLEAVSSHLVRDPCLAPRQALRNWIRFYSSVGDLRDRLLLATFEEVTTDFGDVVDRLNERFGTSFIRFDHTPENVERCFARIEERNTFVFSRLVESAIARPSSARESAKDSHRPKLQAPSLRPLVDRAYRLHELLAGR